MKVAIIDSGIDLAKLYDPDRHGYSAVWVPVETMSYESIALCDLVVIPTGTDNVLLYRQKDVLQLYLSRGGWIYCFDGPVPGLFDGVSWEHTATNHKAQAFQAVSADYDFLLEQVSFEGLACKDGVRGWWCEGELHGDGLVPMIVDQDRRVVAALKPGLGGAGTLFITAAGRLPAFSRDATLAPNRLFANLLAYCQGAREKRAPEFQNLYVHSGNWAQRSFLASEKFGRRFQGVHWSSLNEAVLANAGSIWIPWESNTRALKQCWPLFGRAVDAGATLVVEDLRDDWIPAVRWEPRAVDSTWWRENRSLDINVEPGLSEVFPISAPSMCFWHYHGVFEGPDEETALLTASGGKNVLSMLGPTGSRKGRILLSTLDATFEFGAGKISETTEYIAAVLRLAETPDLSSQY